MNNGTKTQLLRQELFVKMVLLAWQTQNVAADKLFEAFQTISFCRKQHPAEIQAFIF
jgi:hypothetical protein